MSTKSKILVIFPILFLIICSAVYAQTGDVPPKDEGMDMFLLVMLCLFLSVMIGAAVVGAGVAMLILFFLFALMAIGALSTSVALGLYKRSYATGFKSFLVILYGLACSFIGGCGIWLLSGFFNLQISGAVLFFTGACAGLIGGILMALATYKLVRTVIGIISQRLTIGHKL